jgi:hypothetical protein
MQVDSDFAGIYCPMPKSGRIEFAKVSVLAIAAGRYWQDDIPRRTDLAES